MIDILILLLYYILLSGGWGQRKLTKPMLGSIRKCMIEIGSATLFKKLCVCGCYLLFNLHSPANTEHDSDSSLCFIICAIHTSFLALG